MYNLACVLNLAGRRNEALQTLSDLVDRGYVDYTDHQLKTEADLKALHADPRFESIAAKAIVRASAHAPRTN